MNISSQHHTFDIALAAAYGIESAILIHHFQHWIRINRFAKRNIKEGKCWTYQTRKEIQAHFPYWSFDEVRRLCEKLVEKGILITNNFNKSKVDKTLWYAFVNEEAFGVDEESSKKFYERQNCLSKGKSAFPEGKTATPIPDTKPDFKTTDKEEKKKSASPPPSAEASDLCEIFLEKIRERNPKFKEPNKEKWIREFDLLIKTDKREVTEVVELIKWSAENSFWKSTCLSPQSFRKHYDRMLMQAKSESEKTGEEDNRRWAMAQREKYPKQLKDLTLSPKYAMNLSTGKEIPYTLPKGTFRPAFYQMFGGQYVPERRCDSEMDDGNSS